MAVSVQPLQSSFLTLARYDSAMGQLTLTFSRGNTYNYTISPDTFQAFIQAPSKGRFFNAVIKE